MIAVKKCSTTGLSDAVARDKKVASDGHGKTTNVDTVVADKPGDAGILRYFPRMSP